MQFNEESAPAAAQIHSTCAAVLKAEKLHRTVPVSSVPAVRCASGAQCSPPPYRRAPGSQRLAQLLAVPALCPEAQHRRLRIIIRAEEHLTPGISFSRAANCRVSRRSWAAIRSVPRAFTKRSPSSSPAMPGILCVPGSNRSGSWSGMTCKATATRCRPAAAAPAPCRTAAAPSPAGQTVPCVPAWRRTPRPAPPCPPAASPPTGRRPARRAPLSRHSAAMRSTGSRQPNTLDTWVQITASAGVSSACANCRTISSRSKAARPPP